MFKKSLLLCFVALSAASCDISNDQPSNCPAVIGVSTVAVSGPTTATVDQTINLNVSYKTKKNCGDFHSFYKEVNGLEKTITVNTIYDACDCDEVVTTEIAPYAFKEAAAGVYVLKFKETNTTFITHTITVE